MSENTSSVAETPEIPQSPIVKVVDASKLVDDNGDLIFDEFEFIQPGTFDENFILALPNIAGSDLDDLKRNLRRDADGANLDLSVSVLGSFDGSQGKETERWELGWDDGNRVFLKIYPQEFFRSPGASEAFSGKIVPDFIEYYSR